MKNTRRKFLKTSAIAGGIGLAQPSNLWAAKSNVESEIQNKRPEILFFDVNETLLDLEPLKKSVGTILGNAPGAGSLWFATMLQYSLVSTVAGQYHDFGKIGASALQMVAANYKITLTDEQALSAVKPILNLQPHPDVVPALTRLKKDGYRMVSFTNSSAKAVATQLAFAQLESFFEAQLSIEDLGKFKPHRDAYDWAARKMKADGKNCILIAAHGWDVAGANWTGWRSGFISRPGQQVYPLAPVSEIIGTDLGKITDYLLTLKK